MNTIVAAAREQLKDLDLRRDKLLKIIALAESLKEDGGLPKVTIKSKFVIRRPSSVTSQTHEAVRSILEERGKPVKLPDLLSEVRNRGVHVGGKNEGATLSARLSNSDEFLSFRGVGWWFADRPLPTAQASFEEAESSP